jgi:peptidoglycan/LPS O-acetylase OafA/YrhL
MNERIQALRGVSVLLVVIQHGLIGEWLVPTGYFNPAWFGVYLFFIISGCVITESLICDDAHFGRFIVRRVFRLLPAMLAFIALAYALNWLLAKEVGYPLGPITEKRFWIYAAASVTGMVAPFMYMNLFPPVPFMFAHIWSISVEDVFYLIFGLLAAKALIRTSPTTTIRVILGLVLSVMLLRVVGWKWRAPWEALSEAAGRGEIFAWIGQVLLLPLTLSIFGGMDFILAGIVVNLVARGRVSAAPLPNTTVS